MAETPSDMKGALGDVTTSFTNMSASPDALSRSPADTSGLPSQNVTEPKSDVKEPSAHDADATSLASPEEEIHSLEAALIILKSEKMKRVELEMEVKELKSKIKVTQCILY